MLTPHTTTDNSYRGQLLKIGEVAKRLHVSEQTVRDWSETDKLNGILTEGGHRLFYESDVRLCELREKGINTFWSADGIVVLRNDGTSKLICNDTDLKYSDLDEKDLTKWWNYSNGYETFIHSLVLTGKPQITQVFQEKDVYLWGDEDENNQFITTGIQMSVIAIAFSKEEAIAARSVAAEKATDWMRLNFLPKTVIGWFTNSGRQLTNF